VTTKTWNKDTEDLFDFEAKEIKNGEFKLPKGDSTHYIVLKGNILYNIRDDKLSISKDLGEMKKSILEKDNTKILGEIIASRSI
jgi:hypothetical protein